MQKLRAFSGRRTPRIHGASRTRPKRPLGRRSDEASAVQDPGGAAEARLLVSRHLGGRAEVRLAGTVDETLARQFALRMTALADDRVRSVVVDLGGAEVADPAAFTALAAGLTAAQSRNGEVVLKSPRSSTLRLLHQAGLSEAFPVY